MVIRSDSRWVRADPSYPAGWETDIAKAIDDCVRGLTAYRDVITVSVAPWQSHSATIGVIVTVVSSDKRADRAATTPTAAAASTPAPSPSDAQPQASMLRTDGLYEGLIGEEGRRLCEYVRFTDDGRVFMTTYLPDHGAQIAQWLGSHTDNSNGGHGRAELDMPALRYSITMTQGSVVEYEGVIETEGHLLLDVYSAASGREMRGVRYEFVPRSLASLSDRP